MADGAAVDSSYSPAGPTIELVDLASTRPSSQPSSRISPAGSSDSWHPKLTLYRLLVIVATVGLAVAKTATSYLNLTFASITLEWILGVVVFLFFHLLGVYENANNRHLTWLFNVDYMEYLWAFLGSLTSFQHPYYISDEIDARHQTTEIHPLVTGYRVIVTVLVASFGMIKSALLYGQEPMEATALECVFGVGIATGLYWLSLYEASSTKVYPTLFHVDYSIGLSYSITEAAIIMIRRLFTLLGVLLSFLLYGALSYGFYHLTATIIPFDKGLEMGTIEDILSEALIGGSFFLSFIGFFMVVFVFLMSTAAVTYSVFTGFITFFSEARNDSTVDVELVDAPV